MATESQMKFITLKDFLCDCSLEDPVWADIEVSDHWAETMWHWRFSPHIGFSSDLLMCRHCHRVPFVAACHIRPHWVLGHSPASRHELLNAVSANPESQWTCAAAVLSELEVRNLPVLFPSPWVILSQYAPNCKMLLSVDLPRYSVFNRHLQSSLCYFV